MYLILNIKKISLFLHPQTNFGDYYGKSNK